MLCLPHPASLSCKEKISILTGNLMSPDSFLSHLHCHFPWYISVFSTFYLVADISHILLLFINLRQSHDSSQLGLKSQQLNLERQGSSSNFNYICPLLLVFVAPNTNQSHKSVHHFNYKFRYLQSLCLPFRPYLVFHIRLVSVYIPIL